MTQKQTVFVKPHSSTADQRETKYAQVFLTNVFSASPLYICKTEKLNPLLL